MEEVETEPTLSKAKHMIGLFRWATRENRNCRYITATILCPKPSKRIIQFGNHGELVVI